MSNPRAMDQAVFQATVQSALDAGYVAEFEPTLVTITKTLYFVCNGTNGWMRGIRGNVEITSMMHDGTDVMVFTATSPCRHLLIEGLSIYGGVYEGRNSGNGLRIVASTDLYRSTIRDVVIESCGGAGLSIEGGFFESVVDNVLLGGNNGDGIFITNGPGVVSNLTLRGPNSSRNLGYGLRLQGANGVRVHEGSFVLNQLGGIFASNGIRSVMDSNFENTGQIAVDIPTSDWTTFLAGNEVSSDGATTFSPGGQPMQYLYRYGGNPANLLLANNRLAQYGGAPGFMQMSHP